MSVYQMRKRALVASTSAERQREVLSAHVTQGDGTQRTTRAATDAVLQALSTYIPHEALSLFIAVLAILSPGDKQFVGRWVAFGIGAAATPYFLALYNWLDHQRVDWRAGWVTMLFSELSFLLYVGVIPGSPYTYWGWFSPRYGLVAALAYTACVAPVAKRLGLVE